MGRKIHMLRHWRGLTGLTLALFLLSFSIADSFWNTQAADVAAATDAYYVLKPGETLEGVSLRFGLNVRTLRCANPQYKAGDNRINLPLSATRRHLVQPGQTLGQIARLYSVEPIVITKYPLNYWQGCPGGIAGLGEESAQTVLPAGLLLYVPNPPLQLVFSNNSSVPIGFGGPLSRNNSGGAELVGVGNNPGTIQGITPTPPRLLSSTRIAEPPTPVVRVTATPPVTIVPTQPDPLKPTASGPLIWPMRGIITTYFSASHPAIDIATANGMPIVAAQSGLVYFAGWSPYGYGNFVQIEHGDGRQTHYAHLRVMVVKYGDFVSQGQLIGYEGSTGNSTGPHLHFELVIQGSYVDPLQHLPK